MVCTARVLITGKEIYSGLTEHPVYGESINLDICIYTCVYFFN